MEIRRDPAFSWPTKLRGDPRKYNRTKLYEYHGDHGHLTDECITLRHGIKNFIKNGRFVRFLVGEKNRDKNPQGPLLLERNREASEGPEPRCRDHGLRDDWYAELMHNRQMEPSVVTQIIN
jgi:hypothetical protein